MKILTTYLVFALLSIFMACEKEIIDGGTTPPGPLVIFKPVDWTFTPLSSVRDTGYYSIGGHPGPNPYQYTRITEMKVNALVSIDGQPVKFSGDFYLRQVSGNKSNTLGYLNICEGRDDRANNCLEMVLTPIAPFPDIKVISDLKLAQTFDFRARLDTHSGKYNKPENNGRELELKLIVDPQTSSYALKLTGQLVY